MSGEKPIVVSDFDDVIYDFARHFFPYFNNVHGTSFLPDHIISHDWPELLGKSAKVILKTVERFQEESESIDLGIAPSAQAVIPVLSRSHDIVVVTARRRGAAGRIAEIIECYLSGCVAETYLSDDYKPLTKGQLARELGAIVLVDDHPVHAESAIEAGVRGLLFSVPQNSSYKGPVVRVKDWYDIHFELTGKQFSPS